MSFTSSREQWQQPVLVSALIALMAFSASASDWPAYRQNARRSAVSTDRLNFPLSLAWHRKARHQPRPAFADPLSHPTGIDFAYIRDHSEPVLLDFDHAFHPVAAGGRVFFGSSADDAVRCLSLATGQQEWVFVTGGPVRFAPQGCPPSVNCPNTRCGPAESGVLEEGLAMWSTSAVNGRTL